jgi:antitoxin (DNA-binding transcriptional repressor) of toxin-antitoxin stability system
MEGPIMKSVNIHEAKTNLSSILTEIETSNKKYLICRNGKPVAEIVPLKKKNRLKVNTFLSQVTVKCDLTKPLTEEVWDV